MVSSKWIVSKRQDLLWFIGSILISYVFLLLYYGLSNFTQLSLAYSSLFIFFLWTIIFDSTHIFATYTRTYFDKDFFEKNQRLLYGMLGLLFIGPCYMTLFYLIGTQEQYRAAFIVFNRFGVMYAYYHLIRQHWGFMTLYNRKSNISSKIQINLESIILWSGTVYPFFYHHLHYYVPFGLAEEKANGIGQHDWVIVNSILFLISLFLLGIRFLIPVHNTKTLITKVGVIFFMVSVVLYGTLYFGLEQCIKTVLFISAAVFIGTVVIYLVSMISNIRDNNFSLQKTVLLFLVIITNNFILSLNLPYITAYACITVFHNIQYHAIIQFHNKNKYIDNEKKFGWAAKMTKNIFLFIILALGFNLVFTLPRTASQYLSHEFLVCLVASFFWGVGFHHYVLDAIIWRPSRDKEVKTHLGLQLK